MMTTNNKLTTTPTAITLRQQGIPADPTLWSDEHFQVYVRKHTLKAMTPPDDDHHGYGMNKENGKCYGAVLNQYTLTRDLTTLEQLDSPLPDDMSAFEWIADPNGKAPNIFFCTDNNLTDEEFELIKAQLRESPLFKRMLIDRYREQGYQIDLICITGSRLSGICDARSDIDILIIGSKDQNEKTYYHDEDLLLVGKNKPSINMHWYLCSGKDITTTNRDNFMLNNSGCYGNSFNTQLQKNILYANPAAQETIDKYINNDDVTSRDHFFHQAIAIVLPSLRMFVELDTIPEENYSKIWYHVCMYSLILQGKKLINYKEQLLYAKRMRGNGVNVENIKGMMEQIKGVVSGYNHFEDKGKEQAN